MNPSFFLKFFLLLLLTAIGFVACFGDKDKDIPEVSNIKVDLKIHHFEKDLFAADTTNAIAAMTQLDSLYPDFFREIYLSKIIPALQNPQIFSLFISTPEIRHLYDTTMTVYGDFTKLEKDLSKAFQFHQYYFSDQSVPKIVTFISEYSVGNFVAEDQLGIGLDFFLGADYPGYNPSFFPQYIRRSMNRDHLVSKTIEAVADDLVGEVDGDRLLDYMIHNGKKYYVLDLLLPYAPDSIKWQYRGDQVDWLKNNELQLWSHFIGEELLYATRYKDIRKLIDYSPNAPGMPPEAPGRTANWVGYKIVEAFMKRNPEISPAELIKIDKAQRILDESKYKPR